MCGGRPIKQDKPLLINRNVNAESDLKMLLRRVEHRIINEVEYRRGVNENNDFN